MQLRASILLIIIIIATSFTQSVSAESNNCKVAFYGQEVQVESKDMCNYINYHIFMLMLCGILSVIFMMLTAMHIACNSDPETIEKFMLVTFSFLLLTMGFEGPYIALAFLFLSLCLSGPVSACAQCIQRSIGVLRSSVIRPILLWSTTTTRFTSRSAQVAPSGPPLEEVVVVVVVESTTTTTTTTTTNEEVVIIQVDDTTIIKQQQHEECPICLESSEDSSSESSWFTTKCNHTFHLACINKCDICPLCRRGLNIK